MGSLKFETIFTQTKLFIYDMATSTAKKKDRDIEKGYTKKQIVAKLRRLADSLETGKAFRIQIGNEKLNIPADAIANLEHERSKNNEELEFQLKWKS